MNVLVTGGAGYLGSHTSKALAQNGHLPVTYDNLSRGHAWAVRWGPLERGDLSDSSRLKHVLTEYRIEAVLHFAALAYVGESMRQPEIYFENNCVNSFRLLEAMRATGVRHLVFSSSCATYGSPAFAPIDESHPQAPMNPYGESKLLVERMVHWYGAIHGLNWIALRFFNAAGADPELETGEAHDPETHLIPLLLRAAADLSQSVALFGTDYPTPDGTAIRDYVHATDIATAHVKALEYITNGGQSVALNLGSGRGRSVREVIHAVKEAVGYLPTIREIGRRPGDPPCLVADASRAALLLNWTPAHSELQEMVETAWAWERKRMNGICITQGKSGTHMGKAARFP